MKVASPIFIIVGIPVLLGVLGTADDDRDD